MRARLCLYLSIASIAAMGQAAVPTLDFQAESSEFESATRQYGLIWAEHGSRITAQFERLTCTGLPPMTINVRVREAPSFSGNSERPMVLRASYSEPVKRGVLVHELAHRGLLQLADSNTEQTVHQRVNLLLAPALRELWGDDFLDGHVAWERRLTPRYARAWDWYAAKTPAQRKQARQAMFEACANKR